MTEILLITLVGLVIVSILIGILRKPKIEFKSQLKEIEDSMIKFESTLDQIGTIYPMTDQEKEQLGHLEIGEVVLFREGEHIRVNVHVLPHEQPLVFTSHASNEDD